MTPEIVRKYANPIPRYTSYPTAPHFGADVDGAVAADWLAALPESERLSLYIHVPYCRSLCWFCGCHTQITSHDAPIDRYLQSLLEEIALVATRLRGRFTVAHLHFGGGTPTLLQPDALGRLAEALRRHFDFSADLDFAVEIDPRTVDLERAAALAEIGVNRASLGIQDFDPAVQRAINREQPLDVTARVVDMLRGHGIGRISVDLMYGLPFQTERSIARTISDVLSLAPDRIALFGYAHVPWLKKHQRLLETAFLAGAWERWTQAHFAAGRFVAAGYRCIGLDHFATPADALARAAERKTLRRNFQGYTADSAGTLIGFGASAIGSLPQGYAQNAVESRDFAAAVAAKRLPVVRGFRLSLEDRLRAAVIERLMCDLAVDFGALCQIFDFRVGHLDWALPQLEGLAADGLARIDGRRVIVLETARLLVRNVAACFDAYLRPVAAPRHALAV